MARHAFYFLAPGFVLACSIGTSILEAPSEQDANRSAPQLSMQWPIEVGVTSFVTQSPTASEEPYPCGSGVNGQHILHDKEGFNRDYRESLDIVVNPSDTSIAPGEGRGIDVVAVAAGRVVAQNFDQTECDRPFGAGNYLIIEHSQVQRDGKPLLSAYMHLNSYESSEEGHACGTNPEPSSLQDFRPPALGSLVRAGQKLGELGNTGNSTGPHLHFQFATDCVLEPASEVHCPAISLLSVNQAGFHNVTTHRDKTCNLARGIGGPGPTPPLQAEEYLPDGSFVTSRNALPAKTTLALAKP